jgi:hypothetical protein
MTLALDVPPLRADTPGVANVLHFKSGQRLLMISRMRKNAQIHQRLGFKRHPMDARHKAGHDDFALFQ